MRPWLQYICHTRKTTFHWTLPLSSDSTGHFYTSFKVFLSLGHYSGEANVDIPFRADHCCYYRCDETPASWEGKGLFCSNFHSTVRSQYRNSHKSWASKQELMQRPCRNVIDWLATHGLLSRLSYYRPRTTNPGMLLPTLGWALQVGPSPHQSLVKKSL